MRDRQRALLALLEASRGAMALREVRARMAGQATEWEVRGDLQLLRQLALAETIGQGRGAFWRLVPK
ncbi:MAG: hypothetical protein IPL57_10125 [Rubrivivax sp.]|nr:hypothetical protein [Rubrivivax sp.]